MLVSSTKYRLLLNCVRHVNNDLIVQEEAAGLYETKASDAGTLKLIVDDV